MIGIGNLIHPIWVIAAGDLRIFLKERGNYVWLFVMPVAFVYLFGTAMSGSGGSTSQPRPRVVIDNQDAGYLGGLLIEQLDREGLAVVDPAEVSESSKPIRTIRIPEEFTASVEAGRSVDVEYSKSGDDSRQPAALVQVRVTRAVVAVTSAIIAVTSRSDSAAISEESLREVLARETPVPLDVRFAGRRVIPAGFDQSVPGYLVMFTLMNLLIFGGLALSQERTSGTLRRIATHPISRWQLIFGKILGRFLLGTVQIGYLLAVSRIFFGIDYGGNLLLITTTLLVFALGCASLGVLVGAVINNPETVQGVCTVSAVALAALGGCWWPLEVVPEVARQAAMVFPTTWAMNALHQLISFGGGWPEIQTSVFALAGFAAISTGLAAKFLRV